MSDFKPTIADLLENGLGHGKPPSELPVCMDPFEELIAVLTPCLHWFCQHCLSAHVKSGTKTAHQCPVCRHEVCQPLPRVELGLETLPAAATLNSDDDQSSSDSDYAMSEDDHASSEEDAEDTDMDADDAEDDSDQEEEE